MGKLLVESTNGFPSVTMGPEDPASDTQPVKDKVFAWKGAQKLSFAYTPCLVLVWSRTDTQVEFQVIDAESGKLAVNAQNESPKFTLKLDDDDPVHRGFPGTLPDVGEPKKKVSILMLCIERFKTDDPLRTIVAGAHVTGKWPHGDAELRMAGLLGAVVLRDGVWGRLGHELQVELRALGIFPGEL